MKYKGHKYKNVIIDGEPTKYYVSRFGDVISVSKKGKIHEMTVYETKIRKRKSKSSKREVKREGYFYVKLSIHNKSRAEFISRLVANAYIPNPQNKPEVNHKDGVHHNNYYKNLEWTTTQENKDHASKNDLFDAASCEDHAKALYTNSQIHECCKLMESDKYSLSEVSKMTGVCMPTIYNIRMGIAYHKIGKQYIFPKVPRISNSKYTDEMIDKACKMKISGKSTKEISEITGIKVSTLNDVFKGRRRKKFFLKYNF